jgi:hypothetical protein
MAFKPPASSASQVATSRSLLAGGQDPRCADAAIFSAKRHDTIEIVPEGVAAGWQRETLAQTRRRGSLGPCSIFELKQPAGRTGLLRPTRRTEQRASIGGLMGRRETKSE